MKIIIILNLPYTFIDKIALWEEQDAAICAKLCQLSSEAPEGYISSEADGFDEVCTEVSKFELEAYYLEVDKPTLELLNQWDRDHWHYVIAFAISKL